MIMIKSNAPENDSTVNEPLYRPGQIVRHRRYGYRGVVVDSDPSCRADEAWYQANQTQPDRHQPWYHVLVDGSSHSTYAAHTSLIVEEAPERISHPLLEHFFSGFDGDGYVRNDRPWTSGDEA